ncbi:DNA repair protein RecO [Pandoraea pnomenusa]|uniref:DNA repair protein RecO n=1 Tax=Pandoraea pnomenusa TaxID=93220 RepID=A0A378YJP5_9BURK|nr:DNA repair protein RecO [Pandoraea pnomenusa]AIU26797.1 DNA repair protein RecO [Pandoraea pnomenusa]SUA77386.1 Recombination protein O [Pandoraea pnomenusa]
MATSELDTTRDEVSAPESVTPAAAAAPRASRSEATAGSTAASGARSSRQPRGARPRAVDDDASEAFQQAETNADAAKRETKRVRRVTSPAKAAEREQSRVTEQPGFVLHSYPYRETSLIIDVLTRDHGRIALVAKGAKRPHSALRGVLQTFQPLSLAWLGKGELRTLTKAEWVGGLRPLEGDALLSGFYLNELLVKFCARDDPHDKLFQHYLTTLHHLAHGEPAGIILRAFERVLLRETGYAVAFDRCTQTRGKVVPERRYVFHPDWGVRPALGDEPSDWPVISGQTLLDMEQDDYSRAQTVQQSKLLMRFLLNHHLGGVPLNTRQILLDLQKL